MTWGFVATRGTANNKTSGTSLSVSPNAGLSVGSILVVRCSADNYGTTSADSTEHSVADSVGNTYTKIKERRYSAGAAADGVVTSIWICRLTVALTPSSTVTLTLANAVVAKVIGLEQFSSTGIGIQLAGAIGTSQAATAAPTVTLSGLASAEYLWLGQVGTEGPNGDTFTQDTDYANNTLIGTTGSTATGNVSNRFGSRVYTGTADTYNPTLGTARDVATVLGAIQELFPTSKAFADAGHGVDVFVTSYRSMGFAQVGGGVDSFSIPFKALGFSDVAHGSELFQIILKALRFSDAGLGTDVFSLFLEKAFADTGYGADAFTEIITFLTKAFGDTGYGTDAFVIPFRALGFADAGHGVDAFATPFRAMLFTESGHGVDAFVIPFKSLGFLDVGGGSDSFSKLVTFLTKVFSDSGGGSDGFATPFHAMSFSDVGRGGDAFIIVFKDLRFADVGLGIDQFSVEELSAFIAKAFSDAGCGVEAFAIPFKALVFSDVGVGLDFYAKEILGAILKAFSDVGYGVESFSGGRLFWRLRIVDESFAPLRIVEETFSPLRIRGEFFKPLQVGGEDS